jgi:hypothetical protein
VEPYDQNIVTGMDFAEGDWGDVDYSPQIWFTAEVKRKRACPSQRNRIVDLRQRANSPDEYVAYMRSQPEFDADDATFTTVSETASITDTFATAAEDEDLIDHTFAAFQKSAWGKAMRKKAANLTVEAKASASVSAPLGAPAGLAMKKKPLAKGERYNATNSTMEPAMVCLGKLKAVTPDLAEAWNFR